MCRNEAREYSEALDLANCCPSRLAGGGIVLENLSAKKVWDSLASYEGADSVNIARFEEELFSLLKKYFPHRFPPPFATRQRPPVGSSYAPR
jgi:hypothetical protein